MSTRFRQVSRVARVRSIQHSLAALVADDAERRVRTLEMRAAHLERLRAGFSCEPGPSSGAALACRGEMALRLDTARHGLLHPIGDARAKADSCREGLIKARRNQESSERLADRVAADSAQALEKRQSGARSRRRLRPDTEPQA